MRLAAEAGSLQRLAGDCTEICGAVGGARPHGCGSGGLKAFPNPRAFSLLADPGSVQPP